MSSGEEETGADEEGYSSPDEVHHMSSGEEETGTDEEGYSSPDEVHLMSSGEEETGTDEARYLDEERYSSPDEDTPFTGPIIFLKIVSEYVLIFSCQLGLPSTDFLDFPEQIINSDDIEVIRHRLQQLLSCGKKLEELFTVPNQQSSSRPNEIVAVFINFLLRMVESILYLKPEYIAFQNLQTELGFLITFLGDTSMHLQPPKNIVIDIQDVVNEVGNLFYSLFFTVVVFLVTHMDDIPLDLTDIEDMVNDVVSFLHSGSFDILEDRSLQITTEVEETKKAMVDINALVHEIGSFIVFTKNDQVPESGIVDLALSGLLPRFELLKSKIKEHCITVSKMPIDMAPKTGVVSLFIVDSVLDDLMDLINNKSDRIVGLNDEIERLREKLFLLGSSITSIAVQQEAEQEELIIKTRDIAFEVEYVINSFPPVWYLALRLPRFIEKIQLITMAIKEMKNDIDVAGMPEVAKYPDEHLSSQSEETPILEDVIGFQEAVLEILEQLVRGKEQLQIISISGVPGLGKTTLAKKLYNNPSVDHHFDRRGLCVVSQTYNEEAILKDILRCVKNVKKESIKIEGKENLGEAVYKSLKGWRYFIVLDDMWDTKLWDDLNKFFPNDEIGSRILFTTRNTEVCSKVSPQCVINTLPFLSEFECWDLLRKKVFRDKSCPQELLDVGKKIAKNCRGLPLAVVVIAGVLANMENKEHLWQEVARNLSSHLSKNSGNYIPMLELSYNHLPMHLKPCFLYFGAFKEDEKIQITRLISLWIAEGYIKKEEQKSLEDVALEYVMKLIDRSLVLVAKKNIDGSVKTIMIHDLLREMCLRIAEENNFLKIGTINVDQSHPLPYFSEVAMYQKHHCLSIVHGKGPTRSLPFGPHVRSLLCRDVPLDALVACGFKVLRVLDVYSDDLMSFVVIGIEQLVNLRYLALPNKLPPMESFRKLEFLVVHASKDDVEITDVLLNMMSLRHIDVAIFARFSESIRRQAIEDKSFQMKNNLQSISLLAISEEADEKILRCLPNLRTLRGCVNSSLGISFDFLNQLEVLEIESETVHSLPLNLKKLTLCRTHTSPEQMEIIGKLKYLEVLKLYNVSFEGEQWDTREGEFPQLKCLRLRRGNLAEWNTSMDHFPRLQRLTLEYCANLKMIPPSLGDIPTLQMIEVHDCERTIEESAEKIQKEQEDMGNEYPKVIISSWGWEEETEQ